jgi:hypothetical protein
VSITPISYFVAVSLQFFSLLDWFIRLQKCVDVFLSLLSLLSPLHYNDNYDDSERTNAPLCTGAAFPVAAPEVVFSVRY